MSVASFEVTDETRDSLLYTSKKTFVSKYKMGYKVLSLQTFTFTKHTFNFKRPNKFVQFVTYLYRFIRNDFL